MDWDKRDYIISYFKKKYYKKGMEKLEKDKNKKEYFIFMLYDFLDSKDLVWCNKCKDFVNYKIKYSKEKDYEDGYCIKCNNYLDFINKSTGGIPPF